MEEEFSRGHTMRVLAQAKQLQTYFATERAVQNRWRKNAEKLYAHKCKPQVTLDDKTTIIESQPAILPGSISRVSNATST